MKTVGLFFALLAFAGFALSQALPENAGIEGMVLDAVTGLPLSGVTVTRNAPVRLERPKPELLPDGTPLPIRTPLTVPLEIPIRSQVQTNSDGRFLLEGLDSGRIEILFNKAGYSFRGLLYSLTPGQHLTNAVIRLVPFGVISGRVVDTKGNPVVNASVAPFQHSPGAGRIEFTYFSSARTNDRGEFRLIDLAPGTKYWLSISVGGSTTLASPLAGAPASLLYPGVKDLSRALAIELLPGRDTRVNDVVLDASGLGELRIHLRNPAGQPPKDLDLRFTTESPVRGLPDNSGLFYVSSGESTMANNTGEFSGRDPKGEWRIPTLHVEPGGELLRTYWAVQPGIYRVEVKWQNVDGSSSSRSELISFKGEDLDVDLLLATPNLGGVLPGRVLLEGQTGNDTTTLPGVFTYIEAGNSRLSRASTVSGTFQFSGIPEGVYHILSFDGLPANHYVTSAKQGDRNGLTDGLLVSQSSAPLEVKIGQTAGKLKGRVTDSQGRPVHDATLLLAAVPLRETRLLRPTSRTDQNGDFELPATAPGSYKLYAWSSAVSRMRDLDVLKQYEERATAVVVGRSGQEPVDLKILDEP